MASAQSSLGAGCSVDLHLIAIDAAAWSASTASDYCSALLGFPG